MVGVGRLVAQVTVFKHLLADELSAALDQTRVNFFLFLLNLGFNNEVLGGCDLVRRRSVCLKETFHISGRFCNRMWPLYRIIFLDRKSIGHCDGIPVNGAVLEVPLTCLLSPGFRPFVSIGYHMSDIIV